MPLPTSGEIHLNEIHIEAGGGSGTECSLNDTDIRALISASSGSEMEFADWYGAGGGTVTVSGEVITHNTFTSTATAGVRVNNDGTIDRRLGTNYSQIDSSTDWIIPNGSADGTYDVRVSSVTGDTPSGSGTGTWLALSSSREWYVQDTDSSPSGSKTCTFTIEIRKDGGATLDSGSYTLTADYNNA